MKERLLTRVRDIATWSADDTAPQMRYPFLAFPVLGQLTREKFRASVVEFLAFPVLGHLTRDKFCPIVVQFLAFPVLGHLTRENFALA